MKHLYSFDLYCGRMGNLTGLFLATEEEVQSLYNTEIYFGEVLGKHSEIVDIVRVNNFEVILEYNESNKVIDLLEERLGNTISGINPFNYIESE